MESYGFPDGCQGWGNLGGPGGRLTDFFGKETLEVSACSTWSQSPLRQLQERQAQPACRAKRRPPPGGSSEDLCLAPQRQDDRMTGWTVGSGPILLSILFILSTKSGSRRWPPKRRRLGRPRRGGRGSFPPPRLDACRLDGLVQRSSRPHLHSVRRTHAPRGAPYFAKYAQRTGAPSPPPRRRTSRDRDAPGSQRPHESGSEQDGKDSLRVTSCAVLIS
jgi:hypothetical protein